MNFRPCFSNLPVDLYELPGGPRQGSVSRLGYEVAWDAAGNAFPNGEHDDRTVFTIDGVQKKRKSCLSAFDPTGAAGCGSPRDEVRAITIDDHNRRARSEPPKHQTSRVSQLQSMQMFGVPLAIDSGNCGRRQQCQTHHSSESTHQQDARQAIHFRSIEGVLAKKHFVGNRGPKELLSPRLENLGLETIDINSRTRKRQVVDKIVADAMLPTSPCFSLSCEVNHGAWRQASRSHSFDYFEKTLQAERYATLLGRPSIKSDREFNMTRLATLVEEEKTDSRLLETIYSESAEWEIDQSVGWNAQSESEIKDRTSTLSTTASNASGSPKSDGQRLNIESFWPALLKRGRLSDVIGEDSQERGSALPLGLRRVVASLGRHKTEMLSDSLVQELTNHILESQGGKCKTSAGARLRVASRNRYKAYIALV